MSKAIMCVDDEQIVLLSLRDQISRHFGSQYRYEIAESVDEAWEVIEELCEEKVKILIIVSDWLMPGVRGDEFLAAVHQRFPKIIKVMLTGNASESVIDQVRRESNLFACIHKPWNESELMQVIESGLEQRCA
jgi:CheY-like chemotaxis protein